MYYVIIVPYGTLYVKEDIFEYVCDNLRKQGIAIIDKERSSRENAIAYDER